MSTPNDNSAAPDFQDALCIQGGALKSLGDGRIGGYLAAWGTPRDTDVVGDYFTPDTDFMLDRYPIKGHALVMFEHAQDGTLKGRAIGEFSDVRKDDVGLWAEAVIDRANAYAAKLEELLKKKPGLLGWSSGSIPQFVVNERGHIRRWPVAEGSITASPAQPFKTQIQPVKSLNFKSLIELLAEEDSGTGSGGAGPEAHQKSDSYPLKEDAMSKKNSAAIIEAVAQQFPDATAEQISAIVASVEGASAPADMEAVNAASPDELATDVYDEAKATAVQKAAARIAIAAQKAIQAEVQKQNARFGGYAKHAALTTDPYAVGTKAQASGSNSGESSAQKSAPWGSNQPAPRSQVSVSEARKYQGLSHADMIFGAQLLNARHNPSDRPGVTMGDIGLSDEYLRVMANKAQKAADAADAKGNDFMKSVLPWKSDELNQTDVAAQGLEWLGTLQGNDYWETPRARRLWDTLAAAGMRVRELPQGYSAYNMDKEGSDPTVYSPPEASDLNGTTFEPEVTVKQSAFGTGDVTVTPGKMGARVIVTQELIEDSLVPVLAGTRAKMMNTLLDHRDKLLFNGDTTATANTNINLIDGTPGTGSARPYYMATNGIRKNALITNTGQKVDASGANNLALWRLARSKVNAIYRENPENLIYLTNTLTHDSTLAYPELATWDVAQLYATIAAGVVERLFKIPVYGTVHIPLANSSGVVPAAGGTLGTIICLYPNAMVAVIKREITLKTFEYIRSDATEFVATTRLGIGFMVTDALGLVYNVSNATTVL